LAKDIEIVEGTHGRVPHKKKKMLLLLLLMLLLFMMTTGASGLMTPTSQMALREWVRSCSVGLDDSFKISEEGRIVAAKAVARGERVFALTDDAPLSAAEAYNRDRDDGN
jgi:flagellar basal body-associated protein FliL